MANNYGDNNNFNMNTATPYSPDTNRNGQVDPGEGDGYGDPSKKTIIRLKSVDVIGVTRNSDGDIESFHLVNGEVLSFDDACYWISKGLSQGLILQNGRGGRPIIRSAPDGYRGNNLDSLPQM